MRIVLACILLVFSLSAQAATVRASTGAKTQVASAFAHKAQCIIDGLERGGVKIKFMGGYGRRGFRQSKHPAGMAIDINQWRRNLTKPVISRQLGIQVANNCGALSGAVWRHADNGHFEDLDRHQVARGW